MLFCIKTASRLVDLIYILTTKENRKLIEKLKSKTAEFISVHYIPSYPPLTLRGGKKRTPPLNIRGGGGVILDIDCILVGPGLGISAATKKLMAQVLVAGKKAVLDADALNVLDDKLKRLLSPLHILTPHRGEFQRLFKLPANQHNTKLMAKKYHCTIVLKGPVDVIAQPSGKIFLNKTGNAGMTKGGTGDVLAGLIAGLYATNDAFTSAAAGTYVNGAAGDDLSKKVGTFYDAEDLMNQIPSTLHHLHNS